MKRPLAVLIALAAPLFPAAALAAPAEDAPSFTAADAPAEDALVVDLRDDATAADRDALAAAIGAPLVDASPHVTDDGQVYVIRGDRGLLARARALLAGDSHVEAVEPLLTMGALWAPNDPRYADQWHLPHVGSERAWSRATGAGVTVAVIDTGVACADDGGFTKGTDLQGTRCLPGWNFVADDDKPWDDHGHGTHVAGTIAQTTNNGLGTAGLAFGARLLPVKVLAKNGSGSNAQVADGIRWAADHGAQVINLSLGGPFPSAVVRKAVEHAQRRGVLVVAAAGNSGRAVGYPAGFPGVIAVSASDRNDNLAWFSSRGPEVGIAAPGVAVLQQTVCEGGQNKCEVFGAFNGTSMASPHVAGAAALLVSQGVTDPDAVKAALYASARPKGEATHFGAGILDAGAATFATALRHDLYRAFALLALTVGLTAWIRRKGGALPIGAPAAFGALFGAIGLLPFAATLGLPGLAGPARPLVEALAHPLGDLDLLAGVSAHRFALLALPLPTLFAFLLGFQVRGARPLVGGLALGQAAYLVAAVALRDQAFFLGGLFPIVAAAGAAACLWIARIALDPRTA